MVWIDSILPMIPSSLSFFPSPLGIRFEKAPTTIGIIVTFMFHIIFFSSLPRSQIRLSFRLPLSLTLRSAGSTKFTAWQILFSYELTIRSSDRNQGIRFQLKIPEIIIIIIRVFTSASADGLSPGFE